MKKEAIDLIRDVGARYGMASSVISEKGVTLVALFHGGGGSVGVEQKGAMFRVLYLPVAGTNYKNFCSISGAKPVGLGYEAIEHGLNGLKDGLEISLAAFVGHKGHAING